MTRSLVPAVALLAGCVNVTIAPAPGQLGGGTCASFAETAITDPEGVATEDELAEASEALADFASWTAADGVCVDEMRMVSDADPEHPEVVGSYTQAKRLVLVEVGAAVGVRHIGLHELCHAWDAIEGFSGTYEDLLPDLSLDEEIYTTDAEEVREAFAQACDDGPPPRALGEAVEAACGDVDPLERVFREEVFPGYEEDLSIGIGGEISARALEVPEPPNGASVSAVRSYGDSLVVLLWAESASVALLDLASLTWSAPVEVPLGEGETAALLTTLPDAPPVVRVYTEGTDTLLQLDGDTLVPHPADWLAPLLDWAYGTSLSVGETGATWQLWGDGQPLQMRAFDDAEASEVPGAGLLPLGPTGTVLPEGELAWETVTAPYASVPWAVTPEGVEPAVVPLGVRPRATLPDGRVVATATWEDADAESREAWLYRDAEDGWWLSSTTCDTEGRGLGIFAGGGRVVRVVGTDPFELEELTLPEE